MSDNDNSLNVVVQNEFERVLANPSNVIMSSELQEMLPPDEIEDISHEALTIRTADGETMVSCSLLSVSSLPGGARLELEIADASSLMDTLVKQSAGFTLEVINGLNISINECALQSWDVFRGADNFIVGLGVKGEVQF